MPYGDIATDKLFVNGQLGVDGQDLNDITGKASIQPAFYSGQVSQSAPSDTDTLLMLTGGGLYRKCLYSGLFNQNRVRAAMGQQTGPVGTLINGDMAVWQRQVTFTNPVSTTNTADRYEHDKVLTTGTVNITRLDLAGALPGGPFNSQPRYCMRLTASAAETSVPAGDSCIIRQKIERQRARMLFDGVSSLSVWVRASISGTCCVAIRNADTSQHYKQDFSIGTPNVWQRLTLQNIPAMPTGSGSWGSLETDAAYDVVIAVVAGSTFQGSDQSTWAAGNLHASASQTNFLGTINNTFDTTLWQHEPGPVCTPFAPQSFDSNLFLCQRYYWKTYPYGSYAGGVIPNGAVSWIIPTGFLSNFLVTVPFANSMRITPVITTNLVFYSTDGTSAAIRDLTNAVNRVCSSGLVATEKSISQATLGTASTAGALCQCQIVSDVEL